MGKEENNLEEIQVGPEPSQDTRENAMDPLELFTARGLFQHYQDVYNKLGYDVTAKEYNGYYELTCIDPDGGYDSIESVIFEFEEGDGEETPDRYRNCGTTPGCFFSDWHEIAYVQHETIRTEENRAEDAFESGDLNQIIQAAKKRKSMTEQTKGKEQNQYLREDR